ncbi:MAG: TonB-dependent receptor, partial [Gemmatimonadetes bacterium]
GFNIVQGARKDVRQGQLGAQWTGAVGGLQARAAAWGITRDLDNPIVPRVIDLDRRAWGARALVARSYTTRTGVVTWLAGLEWEVQRDDRRNFENDMGRPGALTLDQLERVRALGAFAQVRAPFNDRVWLQGGVRYDRTTFRVDDRLGAGQGALSRALDALSPTAGLHVAPGGGFEFRAAVATSFETPTTTELVNRPDGGGGFNPDLDPTRGVSLEVGAAWAGAAGRARAEVSAWTTDLEDELVPFEDAAQPGRTFFRNAGASTYRGVEATASADPAGWLHMQAAYTFVDAVFDRYELDGTDLAGNRVPGVSRHRLDVRARGTARGAWIEFRTLAVGAVPVDDGNREAAPGYVLLDLRAGTAPLRVGAATLEPFVALDNLTDRAYAAAVTVNAFGGRYYEPGPGRSFFAGLRIRF